MKILITGGAGFIGANFIHYALKELPKAKIINFDALTYAGNLENLQGIETSPNYTFVHGDICEQAVLDRLFAQEKFDLVINFAAESHVDRSILDAGVFVKTNVLGTQILLDCTRKHKVKRFCQVSTDEVYGSLSKTEPPFTEDNHIKPSSPYSAAKAGADHLCLAYTHTHNLELVITRCSNNYGPYQFPEKFIPLFITNAMTGQKLPLYGDGSNIRDWIHVLDHCSGVLAVATRGKSGEVYNLGGGNEWANIDIARQILKLLQKDESLLEFVTDRPGHDWRYAMDYSKVKNELDWQPSYDFKEGLAQTVNWYKQNEPWWQAVKTGAYLQYYEKQNANRRKEK